MDYQGIYKRFEKLLGSEFTSERSVAAADAPMVSRLDNGSFDVCPYCGDSMQLAISKGRDIKVCMKDRYVVPVPVENTAEGLEGVAQ